MEKGMNVWIMVFLFGLAAGLNVVSAMERLQEADRGGAGLHAAAASVCAVFAGVLAGAFGS